MLKTYSDVLKSNKALVQELLIRGYVKEAQFYVTSMIFEAYYTLNKPEWRMGENEGYKDKVEKSFKSYYTHFKDLYNSTPEKVKNQIVVAMKNRMYHEGLVLEKITFEDWMKMIEEK